MLNSGDIFREKHSNAVADRDRPPGQWLLTYLLPSWSKTLSVCVHFFRYIYILYNSIT